MKSLLIVILSSFLSVHCHPKCQFYKGNEKIGHILYICGGDDYFHTAKDCPDAVVDLSDSNNPEISQDSVEKFFFFKKLFWAPLVMWKNPNINALKFPSSVEKIFLTRKGSVPLVSLKYNRNLEEFYVNDDVFFNRGKVEIFGNPKLSEQSYKIIERAVDNPRCFPRGCFDNEYRSVFVDIPGECTVVDPDQIDPTDPMFYQGCKTITKDLLIINATEIPTSISRIQGCLVMENSSISTKDLLAFFNRIVVESQYCLVEKKYEKSRVINNPNFCPTPLDLPRGFSQIEADVQFHVNCALQEIKCNLKQLESGWYYCTVLEDTLDRLDPTKKDQYLRIEKIIGRIALKQFSGFGEEKILDVLNNVKEINNHGIEPAVYIEGSKHVLELKKLQIIQTKGDVAVQIHRNNYIYKSVSVDRFLHAAKGKIVLVECEMGTVVELEELMGCGYIQKDLVIDGAKDVLAEVQVEEIGGCLKIQNTNLTNLNFLKNLKKEINKECRDGTWSQINNNPQLCVQDQNLLKLLKDVEIVNNCISTETEEQIFSEKPTILPAEETTREVQITEEQIFLEKPTIPPVKETTRNVQITEEQIFSEKSTVPPAEGDVEGRKECPGQPTNLLPMDCIVINGDLLVDSNGNEEETARKLAKIKEIHGQLRIEKTQLRQVKLPFLEAITAGKKEAIVVENNMELTCVDLPQLKMVSTTSNVALRIRNNPKFKSENLERQLTEAIVMCDELCERIVEQKQEKKVRSFSKTHWVLIGVGVGLGLTILLVMGCMYLLQKKKKEGNKKEKNSSKKDKKNMNNKVDTASSHTNTTNSYSTVTNLTQKETQSRKKATMSKLAKGSQKDLEKQAHAEAMTPALVHMRQTSAGPLLPMANPPRPKLVDPAKMKPRFDEPRKPEKNK